MALPTTYSRGTTNRLTQDILQDAVQWIETGKLSDPFTPSSGFSKVNLYASDIAVYSPETYTASSTFLPASLISFAIEKKGDRAVHMTLYYTISITRGAAAASYEDWLGLAAISKILFLYKDKDWETKRSREMWRQVQVELNETDFSLAAENLGFEPIAANRVLAASPTVYTRDFQIKIPFSKGMPISAFGDRVKLQVEFARSEQFIRGSTNDHTVTFSNLRLELETIHYPELRRAEIFSQLNEGGGGYIQKILSNEWESVETVPINTLEHTISLKNIKNATPFITVWILPATYDTQATLDNYNVLYPSAMWLADGGTPISPVYTVEKQIKQNQFKRAHPMAQGVFIPEIYFVQPEFVEPSQRNCYGHSRIISYNNPEIVLNFATVNGCALNSLTGTTYAVKVLLQGHFHNAIVKNNFAPRRYIQVNP